MNLFQRFANDNNTKTSTEQDIQEARAIRLNKAPAEQYNLLQQQVNALSNELIKLRELVEDAITRPDNTQDIKPSIVKPANSQLFADNSTRPPKPELTGDAKKLWWILNKIKNRVSYRKIFNHINQRYRQNHLEAFIARSTINAFVSSKGFGWSNSKRKWKSCLGQQSCTQAIPFVYELLSPAEQAEYNDVFGVLSLVNK